MCTSKYVAVTDYVTDLETFLCLSVAHSTSDPAKDTTYFCCPVATAENITDAQWRYLGPIYLITCIYLSYRGDGGAVLDIQLELVKHDYSKFQHVKHITKVQAIYS